ncbi:11943_t:CDS:2 [Gigaspora margarita]|uniref:11943_t:CDS:1 n=1 Tax=Gigaspora margarita TaxID=4874 RepID=A0ABN7UFH4_GIGMA|nr:11943_t:CDS:2 [Gigaspora margarita]
MTIDKDGDSTGKARLSRTINRQPRRLSRSPSRHNVKQVNLQLPPPMLNFENANQTSSLFTTGLQTTP